MSDAPARARKGFAHHHSDEELRRYRALSPEQKLALHAAWKLTSDFLPERTRASYEKMRAGKI